MKTRGFTLVEMVLAIAILGITAGSLGPWMINSMKAYDIVTMRREMLAQVSTGLERMVLEISLIPGRNQVITANATSFAFQYPAGTNVTYSLSGTNLMRNSDVLIQNVTSLGFTYYDEAGSTTTTTANVRSVRIQLSANTPSSTQTYTVRTRVFIRNTGNYYGSFTSP